MTDTELGVIAGGLVLYGAVRLAHDAYRIISATGRGFACVATWIADKWRAHAVAHERRRVKREEGIGALNAEALRDIAGLLVETRAELARARASAPTDHDPGVAMSGVIPGIIPGIITIENCRRGVSS